MTARTQYHTEKRPELPLAVLGVLAATEACATAEGGSEACSGGGAATERGSLTRANRPQNDLRACAAPRGGEGSGSFSDTSRLSEGPLLLRPEAGPSTDTDTCSGVAAPNESGRREALPLRGPVPEEVLDERRSEERTEVDTRAAASRTPRLRASQPSDLAASARLTCRCGGGWYAIARSMKRPPSTCLQWGREDTLPRSSIDETSPTRSGGAVVKKWANSQPSHAGSFS